MVCVVLMIIRPVAEQGPYCYELMGEAYVDVFTYGEALEVGKDWQTIKLV